MGDDEAMTLYQIILPKPSQFFIKARPPIDHMDLSVLEKHQNEYKVNQKPQVIQYRQIRSKSGGAKAQRASTHEGLSHASISLLSLRRHAGDVRSK